MDTLPLDKYIRARQIALAHSLENRTKIYLDVCYWITLRKAQLSSKADTRAQELLDLLRIGVAGGKLLCPISESIFIELLKQDDPNSRRATAKLIDELSLGVALIPFDRRGATEIAYFLHAHFGENNLYTLNELVWTKAAYVLGESHPSLRNIDKRLELHLQKAFSDVMWECRLEDIATKLQSSELILDDHANLAVRLNAANAYHASSLRSFKQTYKKEIAGAVDVFLDSAAGVFDAMSIKATGLSLSKGTPEWEATKGMCRHILTSAFEDNIAQSTVRTLHIEACLHASLRWDKKRQFKPNDFFDFHHASAALAYCDAFFTEGPLRTWSVAPNVRLTALNGCQVASKLPQAIEIVGKFLK